MKVSLVDVDGHNFPNLALMKLAAWHKSQGDAVDWYAPLFSRPDRIYASKVFTFTRDYEDYAPKDPEPIKGGTGYGMYSELPPEVEAMRPDYSMYPQYPEAYGFLSRGCIRSCPWCVVPRKEGHIRPVADIADIAGDRRQVVLMDNNFLANDESFVIEQLDKIRALKLRIDFNQGLDARLVTASVAEKLAKVRYIRCIRFSCDTTAMLPHISSAVKLLRGYGFKQEIFCYALVQNVEEAEKRCRRLIEMRNRPKIKRFSPDSSISKVERCCSK